MLIKVYCKSYICSISCELGLIRFITITPNNQYIVTASEDFCIGVFQIHKPVRVHIFRDVHTRKEKKIF